MRKYVRSREQRDFSYPKNGKKRWMVCLSAFALLFCLKLLPDERVQAVLAEVRAVSTSQVIPKEEDIGRLSYVSALLPEAIQSVWQENTGDTRLSAPFAEGILLSEGKSGAAFEGEGDVLAGGNGKVQSVNTVENGFALTIAYEGNLVATYAPLVGVKVAAGETVAAGDAVGIAPSAGRAKRIYVRAARNGTEMEAKAWLSFGK